MLSVGSLDGSKFFGGRKILRNNFCRYYEGLLCIMDLFRVKFIFANNFDA